MKRTISLLLTLCMAITCFLLPEAGAESKVLEGNPWPNSNLYGNWPSSRPAPEEDYELFVNYDIYQHLPPMKDGEQTDPITRADRKVIGDMISLCGDTEKTGAEEECLRILYGLYMDTENREKECLSFMLACADQVKAANTLDELNALIREK